METVSKLLKEHGLFVLGGAFVGAIGGYFLSPKKAELVQLHTFFKAICTEQRYQKSSQNFTVRFGKCPRGFV